jgi:hypothetical protein
MRENLMHGSRWQGTETRIGCRQVTHALEGKVTLVAAGDATW